MKNSFFAILIIIFLSSCASSGIFSSINATNVELSEGNYQIVAKNVTGKAKAGYILGFSAAFRSEMSTLALIRVSGEGLLYQEALADFWNNFEQQTDSSVEGRKLALINVRYDGDALNVIGLYTQPRVAIVADVIEFE